jgi:hypothetical protein
MQNFLGEFRLRKFGFFKTFLTFDKIQFCEKFKSLFFSSIFRRSFAVKTKINGKMCRKINIDILQLH